MSKQMSRNVTRREVVAELAAGTAVVGLPLVGIGAEDKPRKLKVIVAGAHPDDPESAAGAPRRATPSWGTMSSACT
jgi:hypothetical protein